MLAVDASYSSDAAMIALRHFGSYPLVTATRLHSVMLLMVALCGCAAQVNIPEYFPSGAPGRITVCGDTHGQYYDTLNIFELNGYPSPENPYLFNGV